MEKSSLAASLLVSLAVHTDQMGTGTQLLAEIDFLNIYMPRTKIIYINVILGHRVGVHAHDVSQMPLSNFKVSSLFFHELV